jgi:Na+/H+ antiporter NhaD/arsenite permease-like protein
MTSWLDSSTLGLLFGMMIIVGQLQRTGLFEVLCACALRACRGRMWALTLMILYLTGFVSAFLDNVTTMLLMGPISVSTMAACGRDPAPLLIAQALFSNIGGTATMVGDPPNIIIGNALAPAIGFADFLIHLAPGVIAASVPAALVILLMWRRELTGEVPDHASVLAAAKQYTIRDRALLLKAGVVTAAVVAAFLLHPLHHVDPAVFAILGATLLIVAVAPTDAAGPLKPVEWDMLLFFAGQFVMVEAAAELGLIDMVGGWLASAIRAAPPAARTAAAVHILLWGSAVTSAVLDNIPFTVTMVPVVEYLAAAGLGLELKTLAWALAFGACFGGNATLIGASANIVTASVLERGGRHVTFCEWLKAGTPVTVVSLLAANAYMLRYVF